MTLNFPNAQKIEKNTWEIQKPADQKEFGNCLTNLNALGFIFEDGRGWEPAQIFLHLRKLGVTKGRIKAIIHTNAKKSEIATK